MRTRAAAAVLTVAALLGGCASGGSTAVPPTSSPSGARSSVASSVAAELPPCPRLARVAARADGLPALTLPCLGPGPDVRLSDLRGTPTIVNVWAAWCTNCDREMPLFTRLEDAAGTRVRLFGVHYKAPRDFGLRSAADFGVSFASVHDEDGDETAAGLRAPGPPTTLFVTADGRVAGRKIGEIRSFDELSDLVEKHLGVVL